MTFTRSLWWIIPIGLAIGLWSTNWPLALVIGGIPFVLAAAGLLYRVMRLASYRPAPSAYPLLIERALSVSRDLIAHGPILSTVEAARTDSSGAYHYLRYRPDRVDFWIREGLTLGGDERIGKGLVGGDLAEGVQYMPWGNDPALRNYAVPVLKIELADALLKAGVPAEEAAREVNAAIGPPNLVRMGWGGTHTVGGRRTAKNWWNQWPGPSGGHTGAHRVGCSCR